MIIHKRLITLANTRLILSYLTVVLLLCNSSNLLATHFERDTLPPVFMIGDKEAEYEKLVEECNVPLFSVSNDSMDKAYRSWLGMLQEIEDFAKADTFDINGVKIWINVFWNGEGTIKHITYFPKPNSRNIDYDKLGILLGKFINNYRFKEENETCFSHYGSATFPTHSDYYLNRK